MDDIKKSLESLQIKVKELMDKSRPNASNIQNVDIQGFVKLSQLDSALTWAISEINAGRLK